MISVAKDGTFTATNVGFNYPSVGQIIYFDEGEANAALVGTQIMSVTCNGGTNSCTGTVNNTSVAVNNDPVCTLQWSGYPAINPAYAGVNYPRAIGAFVQGLTNAGIYVILDLHENGPCWQYSGSLGHGRRRSQFGFLVQRCHDFQKQSWCHLRLV